MTAAMPGTNRRARPEWRGAALVRGLAALLMFASLAGPTGTAFAVGGKPKPVDQQRPDIVSNWIERLGTIDASLQAGEFVQAKKGLRFLLDEMRRSLSGGEEAGKILGLARLYRAIALSGLEEEREAAWDFHAAVALFPDYAKADLRPYGEAGRRLEPLKVPVSTLQPGPNGPPAGGDPDAPVASTPAVSKPVKVRGELPNFPRSKIDACEAETISMTMLIGRDGVPFRPSLFRYSDAVLVDSAMEGVRSWRFRPAKVGGTPVVVHYNFSINYKLTHCDNPAAVAAGKKPRN